MLGDKTECLPFENVGVEPETPDVLAVARYKVDVLLGHMGREQQLGQNKDAIIVAADTRTNVPMFTDSGVNIVSKGKPKHPHEARENFRHMLEVAQKTSEDPFYSVNSGAVCKRVRGNEVPLEAYSESQFVLDPTALYYLATDEGFARYRRAFLEFYSVPPYSNNGMKPIDVTDLSGGISLPVLMRLNAITRINGKDKNDPQFNTELRDAIQIVAVGIPNSILKPFVPQAEKRYQNWAWLNGVVEHALTPEELYEPY